MSNGKPSLDGAVGLMYLHAQTALHPGSGTALGTVDLPVQRERHTQWPLIPGSGLKGILRDRCRRQTSDGEELWAAFGPNTDEASKHAGALSISDARLLAFPVRSLRGVFAWVTCPAVLERFLRDLSLAGASMGWKIPELQPEQALTAERTPLLVDDKQLVLEEFQFQRVGDLANARMFIATQASGDDYTRQRITSHLVVLHDDDFTHFVRHSTEVNARIALDYETKTVRKGALFYQEFLPAESLFYSVVLSTGSRREGLPLTAGQVLQYLRSHMPDGTVLQVGGDETTGKGLCQVRLAVETDS